MGRGVTYIGRGYIYRQPLVLDSLVLDRDPSIKDSEFRMTRYLRPIQKSPFKGARFQFAFCTDCAFTFSHTSRERIPHKTSKLSMNE